MEIKYSALQSPKPGSNAKQCEDAFAFSESSAIAAVCDGAGRAFESRLWARLLANSFVKNSPLGLTNDALLDWVDSVAVAWSRSIPWERLNVFEEEKARLGSTATLIGLQLAAPSPQATNGTWQCLAMGDSCLFQVSQGRLARALPLKKSSDFSVHTPLLSTQRGINEQIAGKLMAKNGNWQDGDRFFLLTDAVAKWFLSEYEQGNAPWDFLSSLDEQPFKTFVQDKQARGLMRQDDVTVFMMRVGVPLATPGPATRIPVPAGSQPHRTVTRPAPVPSELVPGARGARHRDTPVRPGPPATPPGYPPASGHPPQAPSPGGPGRVVQFARSRAAWITGVSLVLIAAIAIGLTSLTSGPSPQPVSSAPAVQPAAQHFVEQLGTYTGGGTATYAAYKSALSNSVVGKNDVVISKLLDLKQAPPDSFRSQANVISVAVVHSTRSRAELYVLVKQVITTPVTTVTSGTCRTRKDPTPHSCITSHTVITNISRSLLVKLIMVVQGRRWLVSTGQVSLVGPADGVFVPTTSSAGTSP
jgi:Protein phosphatase 2C